MNLGNPGLKPFFSNNIDLGAEYYTGGAGYFGVTAFRKSLSGFPASTNVTEPFSYLAQFGINYAGLNVTQQTALNGRGCTSDTSCSATITVVEQVNQAGLEIINGLEFDYVQPLDFLLADYGLEGFGFNGNLTILDQRSTGIAPSFAAGVAPMSYNVTGYYDHNGLSVRLSYVFTDKSYGTGTSNNQNVCLPSTAAAPTLSRRRILVHGALWPGGHVEQLGAFQAVRRSAHRSGTDIRCPESLQVQATLLRPVHQRDPQLLQSGLGVPVRYSRNLVTEITRMACLP